MKFQQCMARICVCVSTIVSGVLLAANSGHESLERMVVGQYVIVGKQVESDITYHGTADIFLKNNRLLIKRVIDGQVELGKAAVESAAGGDAKVLRMRFNKKTGQHAGKNFVAYEQTCMIGSDLDNYARLSCHVYKRDGSTKKPGLETFFIEHSAVERAE